MSSVFDRRAKRGHHRRAQRSAKREHRARKKKAANDRRAIEIYWRARAID
jgi:hypothetical protein